MRTESCMSALRSSCLTQQSLRAVLTEFEIVFLCLPRLGLCVVNWVDFQPILCYTDDRKKHPLCGHRSLHEAAEIRLGFTVDYTFDHLRLRATRITCRKEHTKAVNPDAKVRKARKNQVFSVWDVESADSNPVTPTKIEDSCFAAFYQRWRHYKKN